ncbi:MAG: protoporphyrinogen oxidase [Planctomycetaceae bacterium]
MTRVAVLGAGIAGLAAAYRLAQAGADVVVLEADARPGGLIRDVALDDLSLPAGPDAFVARKPWATRLCRELGVELVAPAARGSWLWTGHGLVRYLHDTAFAIPGDPGSVLRWPGVSGAGRRRALLDLLKRARKGEADETLGSLLRRRLGDEVTDRVLAPFLAGVFAGDVDRLSVHATFPELAVWEATQGSLIRGAQAALRDARHSAEPGPMFVAPRDGMDRLPAALAERLGDRVRTTTPAEGLRRHGDRRWQVMTPLGPVEADAVVLAVPAAAARRLLEPVAREVSAEVEDLRAVSTGVALLVYTQGTDEALPGGAGFLVPSGAAPMTSCTWLSTKWPRDLYGTRAVLRCTIGADGDEDVLEAEDGEIVAACERHLAALLPLPERAEAARVVRWPGSMPQYDLGHLQRVERIRDRLPAGIFVCGQAFDGAGIAGCVRSAEETALAVAGSFGLGGTAGTDGAAAPTDEETDR